MFIFWAKYSVLTLIVRWWAPISASLYKANKCFHWLVLMFWALMVILLVAPCLRKKFWVVYKEREKGLEECCYGEVVFG